MIFKKPPKTNKTQKKLQTTPSPKKVTRCTSKGSPHRRGGSAAKLHPIPAVRSRSFCQDLPPLSCLGQLPKSPRCSPLASSALLEHRAHLELLKPKYPPPFPASPTPKVRFFQS